MVADVLANASLYRGLSRKIADGLDYLARTDFTTVAPGKHVIDGDDMFALLVESQTRPIEDCRWESHQRYIDIQFMVRGSERMGVGPIGDFVKAPYDPGLEVYWLEGTGDYLTFRQGMFMIFWPGDAHRPGLQLDGPSPVLKAVVKIAIDG